MVGSMVAHGRRGPPPGGARADSRAGGRTAWHLPCGVVERTLPEDIAVRADGVSKVFRLPHRQVNTLKERAVHPTPPRQYEALEALRDVSLEVKRGEFFGIVGRNGSGKSTLMKCLAGIYRAADGDMWVRGRMAPFI